MAVIQHQCIKGIAWLKQADLLAKVLPEFTAAHGGQVQRFGHRQRGLALVHIAPAQLAYLHSRSHHGKQVQRVAACHIAAQADAPAAPQILGRRGNAGNHVLVAGGAVGNHHAVGFHGGTFFLAAVDAVGHHSGHIAAKQAVAAVTLAVIFRAGAQRGHPFDLAGVLGEVALGRYFILGGQFAQTLHVLVAGTGGKARGDHRAHRAVVQHMLVGTGVQPAAGLSQAGGRRGLPVKVRAVAVHAQLAHKGRKPGGFQLVHQFQRGIGVQRAKDAGAGGGAVRKVPHKVAIARAGIVGIGVVGFLGVGVLLQPVQQFQIHGGAAVAVLRRMQVQVHKARRDDLPTVVVDRHTGGGCLTKCPAAAILTQHIAIPHPQGIRGGGIYKNALNGKTFHMVPPDSRIPIL